MAKLNVTTTFDIAREATPELLTAMNSLVPQVSSTALPLTMSQLETLVSSPTTSIFVARRDGILVGTLTLVVFDIPTGRRAWIEDVVVDTSIRGSGLGEGLTRAAIAVAKEQGVRSIDLTSRPSREAANALYLKLGFEVRETNVDRFW